MNIIKIKKLLLNLFLMSCVMNIIDAISFDLPLKENENIKEMDGYIYYFPIIPKVGQKVIFIYRPCPNASILRWSFGDGRTSEAKYPTHIYDRANIYSVNLSVLNENKKIYLTRIIIVTDKNDRRSDTLKANFTYDPPAPSAGIPVQFLDKTVGNPIKWYWQFNYFNISLSKNPNIIFYSSGKYFIRLTVEDSIGRDTSERFINVAPPPKNVKIAKSCFLKDVQAAIAEANPGDIVLVPPGVAKWESQLLISKGIILKGAGIGKTIIISDWSSDEGLIKYTPNDESENQVFRLTGFEINCNKKSNAFWVSGAKGFIMRKFRVDHNKFYGSPDGHFLLYMIGQIYGVYDNNIIENNGGPVLDILGSGQTTWDVFGTYEFGTGETLYFENNTFILSGGTIAGSSHGARYCFRYNDIYYSGNQTISPVFDAHGNQGAGNIYATMGVEIYENKITTNGPICLFDQRGGRALVFNNYINTNYSIWNKVREEYLDSLNPTIASQPQYPSDSYYWNFVRNGSIQYTDNPYVSSALFYATLGREVPKQDIDFWSQIRSFDGSAGMGVGLLSERPSVCTKNGVGYWAIDVRTLYRWKNGNWEYLYSPYMYPHPLRLELDY